MSTPAEYKRWKISDTLLRSAHRVLPEPRADMRARFDELQREFVSYLNHNEHELALDMLQEMGEIVHPRGGFWRELIRAAENMQLSQRIPYFEQKFSEALARLSQNDKPA